MERKRPLLRLFVGPPARTQWSGWLVVSGSRRKCFFYASGTFSIRSGLLAPVHSFATDDTRGIFLWWFFLLMTGISMILFYQMKQQASVRRTYKKEMVVARSTLVHLRHSARAQPRPVMLWKN
ncbi:BnaUnng03430D, partial [Brassica napus]